MLASLQLTFATRRILDDVVDKSFGELNTVFEIFNLSISISIPCALSLFPLFSVFSVLMLRIVTSSMYCSSIFDVILTFILPSSSSSDGGVKIFNLALYAALLNVGSWMSVEYTTLGPQ